MMSAVIRLAFIAVLATQGETQNLRSTQSGRVDAAQIAEAERSLVAELAANASAERLAAIEAMLRPTYAALPKGPNGQNLGHQAVRYVLHRLFVQRHNWYLRGLEPGDEAEPLYLEGEWVPAYLQKILEERLAGERGINLHELAALVAAIEDLVHNEALANLEEVYHMHGFPTDDLHRITSNDVHEAVSSYMMFFLRGGNFSMDLDDVHLEKLTFMERYTDWSVVEAWFRDIADSHIKASETGGLDQSSMRRVLADVGENFGAFNDRECRDLKRTMLEMEVGQTGRVRLSDFYAKGFQSHWQFNEKADYLRHIGALDEKSDPKQARVILPNYISSRGNCLEPSRLYAVCCPNECEDLLGKLENEVAQPTASTTRIIELVQALGSDTVVAPRTLSAALIRRLNEIAAQNGGRVPLHGRLFAQWMHHAFPRECPYPHELGKANPQTPEEWMAQAGVENARASEEERRSHVADSEADLAGGSEEFEEEPAELHWSDVEELYCSPTMRWHRPVEPQSRTHQVALLALGLLILTAVLAIIALEDSRRKRPTALPAPGAGVQRDASSICQNPPAALFFLGLLGCAFLVGAADAFGLLNRTAFGGALFLGAGGYAANKLLARMSAARAVGMCAKSIEKEV